MKMKKLLLLGLAALLLLASVSAATEKCKSVEYVFPDALTAYRIGIYPNYIYKIGNEKFETNGKTFAQKQKLYKIGTITKGGVSFNVLVKGRRRAKASRKLWLVPKNSQCGKLKPRRSYPLIVIRSEKKAERYSSQGYSSQDNDFSYLFKKATTVGVEEAFSYLTFDWAGECPNSARFPNNKWSYEAPSGARYAITLHIGGPAPQTVTSFSGENCLAKITIHKTDYGKNWQETFYLGKAKRQGAWSDFSNVDDLIGIYDETGKWLTNIYAKGAASKAMSFFLHHEKKPMFNITKEGVVLNIQGCEGTTAWPACYDADENGKKLVEVIRKALESKNCYAKLCGTENDGSGGSAEGSSGKEDDGEQSYSFDATINSDTLGFKFQNEKVTITDKGYAGITRDKLSYTCESVASTPTASGGAPRGESGTAASSTSVPTLPSTHGVCAYPAINGGWTAEITATDDSNDASCTPGKNCDINFKITGDTGGLPFLCLAVMMEGVGGSNNVIKENNEPMRILGPCKDFTGEGVTYNNFPIPESGALVYFTPIQNDELVRRIQRDCGNGASSPYPKACRPLTNLLTCRGGQCSLKKNPSLSQLKTLALFEAGTCGEYQTGHGAALREITSSSAVTTSASRGGGSASATTGASGASGGGDCDHITEYCKKREKSAVAAFNCLGRIAQFDCEDTSVIDEDVAWQDYFNSLLQAFHAHKEKEPTIKDAALNLLKLDTGVVSYLKKDGNWQPDKTFSFSRGAKLANPHFVQDKDYPVFELTGLSRNRVNVRDPEGKRVLGTITFDTSNSNKVTLTYDKDAGVVLEGQVKSFDIKSAPLTSDEDADEALKQQFHFSSKLKEGKTIRLSSKSETSAKNHNDNFFVPNYHVVKSSITNDSLTSTNVFTVEKDFVLPETIPFMLEALLENGVFSKNYKTKILYVPETAGSESLRISPIIVGEDVQGVAYQVSNGNYTFVSQYDSGSDNHFNIFKLNNSDGRIKVSYFSNVNLDLFDFSSISSEIDQSVKSLMESSIGFKEETRELLTNKLNNFRSETITLSNNKVAGIVAFYTSMASKASFAPSANRGENLLLVDVNTFSSENAINYKYKTSTVGEERVSSNVIASDSLTGRVAAAPDRGSLGGTLLISEKPRYPRETSQPYLFGLLAEQKSIEEDADKVLADAAVKGRDLILAPDGESPLGVRRYRAVGADLTFVPLPGSPDYLIPECAASQDVACLNDEFQKLLFHIPGEEFQKALLPLFGLDEAYRAERAGSIAGTVQYGGFFGLGEKECYIPDTIEKRAPALAEEARKEKKLNTYCVEKKDACLHACDSAFGFAGHAVDSITLKSACEKDCKNHFSPKTRERAAACCNRAGSHNLCRSAMEDTRKIQPTLSDEQACENNVGARACTWCELGCSVTGRGGGPCAES